MYTGVRLRADALVASALQESAGGAIQESEGYDILYIRGKEGGAMIFCISEERKGLLPEK